MDNMNKKHLKHVFETWVRDQVDCWIHEYEAWDHMVPDDISEEELEYIQGNLSVGYIEIKEN